MVEKNNKLAFGTGSSVVVEKCQICGFKPLDKVIFLGYLPPVNQMHLIGEMPREQPGYPALVLQCPRCKLVQLGLVVDPQILFPPEYPYTSGTTKILRDNFAELSTEVAELFPLDSNDLVVDIGSNDGTLLSNFAGKYKVVGITPEDAGKLAIERGIPTLISYFNHEAVKQVIGSEGKAKLVTATNVFAHIENIHEVTECILELLTDDGIFISESHYLVSLIGTLQYDTIYHEHLRYYSLYSLKHLLEMHGLEVIHAKRIPTHGGSIRVYAARHGIYPVKDSVNQLLTEEDKFGVDRKKLEEFKKKVVISKMQLHSLMLNIKKQDKRIYGIGAPSRASTLVNYVGIDEGIVDYVMEVKGSHKIGKYLPGTLIPVVEESKLFEDQPEYAILFSWHIADELIPKLKSRGYMGSFIIPLPTPQIIR